MVFLVADGQRQSAGSDAGEIRRMVMMFAGDDNHTAIARQRRQAAAWRQGVCALRTRSPMARADSPGLAPSGHRLTAHPMGLPGRARPLTGFGKSLQDAANRWSARDLYETAHTPLKGLNG